VAFNVDARVRQAMREIAANYPHFTFSSFDEGPLLAYGPIKRAIDDAMAAVTPTKRSGSASAAPAVDPDVEKGQG
jgi:hypothetical protein